jgi:hypothetical protein
MMQVFFDALPCIIWLCLKISLMHIMLWRASVHTFWVIVARVVLLDVLGGKDVVEGRDGRTDGRVG